MFINTVLPDLGRPAQKCIVFIIYLSFSQTCCPAPLHIDTSKSPTSVALASVANGNLSIVSVIAGIPPPDVYPLSVDDCPVTLFLATVKFPTSVALVSEENGNLSITLEFGGM